MAINDQDILRVVLNYAIPNGSAAQNVFTFIYDGNQTADNDGIASLTLWAQNVWGAAWAEFAAQTVTLDTMDISIINTQGVTQSQLGTVALSIAGLRNAEAVSAAVSALLVVETIQAGVRGKKYVPGMAETRVGDGIINAAGLTDLLAMFNAWNTGLNLAGGGTLSPVVLSRTIGNTFLVNGSGYFDDIPAYQRRRKPGVGI